MQRCKKSNQSKVLKQLEGSISLFPINVQLVYVSNSLSASSLQESVLNGRLEPLGTIDGFTAEIGASGAFCQNTYVYLLQLSSIVCVMIDAPSSYFVSTETRLFISLVL